MKSIAYLIILIPLIFYGQKDNLNYTTVYEKEVFKDVTVIFNEVHSIDGIDREIKPFYRITVSVEGSIEYVIYNSKLETYHQVRIASTTFSAAIDEGLKNWFIEINNFGSHLVKYDLYKDKVVDVYKFNSDKKFDPENY